MSINLTPILQAVIILISTLITYWLAPLLKMKLGEAKYKKYLETLRVLILAAEQLYGTGKGPDKLDYVCDGLKQRGYTVDRAQIEATVYEEFNKGLSIIEADNNGNE